MRLIINGVARKAGKGTSVAALLRRMRIRRTEVAVMINGCVVPRASHESHVLSEGDKVEIVSYAGGG